VIFSSIVVLQSSMGVYLENMLLYFHVFLCPGGTRLFTLKISRKIFIYCCALEEHGSLP